MKITHLKKLMLLSIALLVVLPSNAMWAGRGRKIAEGFRKSMRVVHWGVLCGPSVAGVAYRYYEDKEIQKATADHDVVAFVRDTLKEQGYPSSLVDTVSVYRCQMPRSSTSGIGFPLDSSMLKEALYSSEGGRPNQLQADQLFKDLSPIREHHKVLLGPINHKTLALWQGIICHEGAHVQNKDHLRFWGFALAAPLLSHVAVKTSTSPLRSLIDYVLKNKAQTSLAFARGVGYIPSVLIKLSGAFLINCLYSKHRENMADEEVRKRVKDPKILHGFQEFLENIHKKTQDDLSRQKGLLELFEKYPILYEAIDPIHPYYLTRAQRFEEAAKRLEKELAEKEDLDLD